MTVVPKESVVDLLPLTPCVQRAKWGVPARRSLAARFYAHNTDAGISHTDVCSAIAIGTHSSAETVLADDSRTLLDYIRNEVIEVDSNKVEHYTRLHRHGLPFVLRLISVESPQPIHVHPDGVEAARLHESDSVRWPDSLGRAEMVVALTDVHALFGFRGADAIVAELARVPEFADAAGRAATDAFVRVVKSGRGAGPDALRELFLSFMNARPEHVRKCLENVIDRFGRMPKAALSDDDDLLLRLHERFAGDLMCFCVYFFNHVTLQPGEAVFIHPKEPHCYLKGDLIEVSSSSANIARAGLCAEDEVDREQFLNLLNFDDSPVEISRGEKRGDFTTEFVPPVDEFMLAMHRLPAGKQLKLSVSMAPSVIAVLSGEGFIHALRDDETTMTPIRSGSVYYLRGGSKFALSSTTPMLSDVATPLQVARVGINETSTPDGSCVIL